MIPAMKSGKYRMSNSKNESNHVIGDTTVSDLCYLVSCAVNDRVPDRERISSMDVDAILKLASKHMIGAAAAMALQDAGCQTEQTGSMIGKALRRAVLFETEWNNVRSKLEEAKIWYMPLKGAILKDYYPKYGMREMVDYDFLIDSSRQQDIKELMENLGFTADSYQETYHDVYKKPPVFNFQMHVRLFLSSKTPQITEYYENAEERLLGEGYEKHFTKEDFYLYIIAHEFKHYDYAGTGLRSLLDTYVYLKKENLDWDYVAREAAKLGLTEFERQNRELSMRLFDGEDLTEEDIKILNYMVVSGVHGSPSILVEKKMKQNNWGKTRYALDRFLVPVSPKNEKYSAYAEQYPTFYKHKILLPFLPFYRTFHALRKGKLQKEVRNIRRAGSYQNAGRGK